MSDTYYVEVTDTFGGQANYGWVRRAELTVPPALSRRSLVRRAKALMGWSGRRCAVYDYGDAQLELRPHCSSVVMFITYAHSGDPA